MFHRRRRRRRRRGVFERLEPGIDDARLRRGHRVREAPVAWGPPAVAWAGRLGVVFALGCRSAPSADGAGEEAGVDAVGATTADASDDARGPSSSGASPPVGSPHAAGADRADAHPEPQGEAPATTTDEADLVAVLDALPTETEGVVVVRDVALVKDLLGLVQSSIAASDVHPSGTPDAGSPPTPASGAPPTADAQGRGPAMLGTVTGALLGVQWPERRGGVLSWSATSLRLTLPIEDLLSLDPLVGALAGGQATAASVCSVSSLRYAWVTCTVPRGGVRVAAPPASAQPLRDALAELAPTLDEGGAPSVRAAWVMREHRGVARARLVVDGPRVALDVHLPEAAAATLVPFSPRLPHVLAAAGEARTFAWWNVDPRHVAEAIIPLPAPLQRAAKSWTGEALVVGAEAPDRVELLLGVDEPGATLGVFGMVSVAATFGIDLHAWLPEWDLRVEPVAAFEQQFEVLSLEKHGGARTTRAAGGDAMPWEDARRAFATPTVDALWIGLGVSLAELASSPRAAQHALRLERGATRSGLPERAKADLAAGRVGALVSLDVVRLLDDDAIAASRRLWSTLDVSTEREWGPLITGLASAVRRGWPASTRLVGWSCELGREGGEGHGGSSGTGPTGTLDPVTPAAAIAAIAASSSRVTHVHVELCTTCGEGGLDVVGGDWQPTVRGLMAIVGSYAVLRALVREEAP